MNLSCPGEGSKVLDAVDAIPLIVRLDFFMALSDVRKARKASMYFGPLIKPKDLEDEGVTRDQLVVSPLEKTKRKSWLSRPIKTPVSSPRLDSLHGIFLEIKNRMDVLYVGDEQVQPLLRKMVRLQLEGHPRIRSIPNQVKAKIANIDE